MFACNVAIRYRILCNEDRLGWDNSTVVDQDYMEDTSLAAIEGRGNGKTHEKRACWKAGLGLGMLEGGSSRRVYFTSRPRRMNETGTHGTWSAFQAKGT